MTFRIKSVLKKAWEGIQKTFDAHGPFGPAADVKKKLEEKGYCFTPNATTFPVGVPAMYFDITAPDGRPVGRTLFGSDAVTDQYFREYETACKECRAAEKQKGGVSSKPGVRP